MYYYSAFGLTIASEPELPQLNAVVDLSGERLDADIQVRIKDLSDADPGCFAVAEESRIIQREKDRICYDRKEIGRFEIINGRFINIHPYEGISDDTLSLFIMGRCMGCVFAQRGIFALHGSCVCRDGKAIVICGHSGAGKSTLASEFLSRGWKLMADDITVIQKKSDVFCAVSSFPAQKLWKDAIDYYEYDSGRITPLMKERSTAKYHVDITGSFYEGITPIAAIIHISPREWEFSFSEYLGVKKVQRILKDVYLHRGLYDDEADRTVIQTALELAKNTRVFFAVRNNRRDCSRQTYEHIIEAITTEE